MLRIMDTNRRSYIGCVYDGISGKKAIKDVFRHTKRLYNPFTDIIKARWDKQLRRDIHAVAYLLNFTSAYDRENTCKMKEIIDVFIEMVTTLIGDKSIQRKCFDEVCTFHDRLGSFGRPLPLDSSKTMQPDKWWKFF
ncbi:hypothetical protein ACS0TY_009662 [Phlomoides rotata]